MFNFFHLSGIWPLLPSEPLPHIVCARSHIRWSLSFFLFLSSPLPLVLRVGLPQHFLHPAPSLSLPLSRPSLASSVVRMDGWRAGRGRGLPRNVTGLFLFRLHSLPGLQAPATWGCHMPIRQWGVTETCGSNLQHPRCETSSRNGEGREWGRQGLWGHGTCLFPLPCAWFPERSLILQRSNCRNWGLYPRRTISGQNPTSVAEWRRARCQGEIISSVTLGKLTDFSDSQFPYLSE